MKRQSINHSISNKTAGYLFLVLIFSIIVGETMVLLFINTLPPFSKIGTVLFNSFLLIIPVFLILYFFIFRPMTVQIARHKQTEKTLVQEQSLMRNLMDSFPDYIYFKDNESRFIKINKASAKKLNLIDPIQAIGKKDFDFFTDEHAKQAYEDEQMIIRTGQMLKTEEKETASGRPDIWVSTIKLPLRAEDGNIIGTFGISRDITERKGIEIALQESESVYRNLMNRLPDGVYKSTHDGKFVDVNPAMVAMLGYENKEELMSIDIKTQLYFETSDRESLVLQEKLQENGIYRLKKKDGSGIWVEDHGWYNLDKKGNILFHEGILRDVTDRKRTEDALLTSEEWHRTIIQTATDGYLLTDIHGRVLEVNESYCRMSGYSEQELLEKSIPDLEAAETTQEIAAKMRGIMDQGDDHFESRHFRKNGSIYDVELRIQYKPNEGGRFVAFVHDFTQRKQLEEEKKLQNEELQKTVAEKDKFFSIIAHDLRSPFNGFLGLTHLMADELASLTIADIQQIAVSLRNSATNLFRLLENLLEWARMQQGLLPFNKDNVKLLPIIRECLEMLKETANNKGINITSDIPNNLEIFADSNMLQTVIRNLVSNALKFTSNGGKIFILAKRNADKSVEISVRDTGIGMSPEMVDHLFSLDVQSTRAGTEGEPSTGLGLLLCKEFVEKHEGKLWVESEEGKGSIFYFSIPEKV